MKCLSGAVLLASATLLLLGQVATGLSVRPRRDLLETGKALVIQGISKVKEALDNGVNVKSEGKRSIDLFGFKFGGGSSVNAGFGDAANEDGSETEEDLVRRRRAVDVLGAAYAVSLLPQSSHGTNVNIVKVSSVSNVNNFGELPPAEPTVTTAAELPAARRRRSPDMVHLVGFQKQTYTVDSESGGNRNVKKHETLETIKGGSRTLVKDGVARSKRSPQEENGETDAPPKGPPPRGGPRGPHGRGPPGGCRGGRPPPGEEEDASTTAATAERRRKRDTIEQLEMERSKRSPKGMQSASCRGGKGGGQATTPPTEEVRRKRDTSDQSSDYSEHSASESEESLEEGKGQGREMNRTRRQAFGGGEGAGKVGSWFEQLAGVFKETVKKVVEVTKKTFGRGETEM
ncbi:uncharacterized protein LOC126564797 [Anopheles maculipalpis]|uniref:uncharacterized protein LOC126564797 n=1 Tax=Anopheles maculipalpis TaxID=1496333 RepID=UPI0021598E1F|nr:uncharacterized protein LOC126564797 [Anopheles maculipalpis]